MPRGAVEVVLSEHLPVGVVLVVGATDHVGVLVVPHTAQAFLVAVEALEFVVVGGQRFSGAGVALEHVALQVAGVVVVEGLQVVR
ncbi:hypothetical protein, partial [Methylibium rhizosphaerae]|uniref:hypothetical protein n=1 Tax=Methylibium rhizosphaerae TaxID=2570323 RepID=UPI001C612C63